MISPIRFSENVGIIIETREAEYLLFQRSRENVLFLPILEYSNWRWKDDRKKLLIELSLTLFGITLQSKQLKQIWQGRKGISLFRYKGEEFDRDTKISQSNMFAKVEWVLLSEVLQKKQSEFSPLTIIFLKKYQQLKPYEVRSDLIRRV